MPVKISFLVVFLLVASYAQAFSEGFFFHQQSLRSQKSSLKSGRRQGTTFFTQRLNHFDQTDERTFKQRYFVDSRYAENENSPVFYIICGEWNCAGTGSYGHAVNLAKKMKAHLVALEHRYYGESLPFTSLTPENLQYLNLESTIEDLATFQRHMMESKKLQGQWVAFGGSYAGTLSSFYRMKHPELVIGSLASSAPVFMKPEFNEYGAHLAKVINRTACGETVRKAIPMIEEKIKTTEGFSYLKTLFKAQAIRLESDFMYVVADMLAYAVQYGRDEVFCESLVGSSDLVEGYAKGGLAVLTPMGISPVDISMQSAEKVEVTPDDYFRQWMWQSCSEFGWFQVANGTGDERARSTQVDLEYHAQVCERLYQRPMRADGSLNSVWYENLFLPTTTQIIFSNGANDPWLTLSVVEGKEPSHPGLLLFMMEGAAHCSDLKAVTAIPAVLQAQVQMEAIIASWLKL